MTSIAYKCHVCGEILALRPNGLIPAHATGESGHRKPCEANLTLPPSATRPAS